MLFFCVDGVLYSTTYNSGIRAYPRVDVTFNENGRALFSYQTKGLTFKPQGVPIYNIQEIEAKPSLFVGGVSGDFEREETPPVTRRAGRTR